jgi:hypothetical protein
MKVIAECCWTWLMGFVLVRLVQLGTSGSSYNRSILSEKQPSNLISTATAVVAHVRQVGAITGLGGGGCVWWWGRGGLAQPLPGWASS